MSDVQLRDVSVAYDDVVAVREVNLTVPSGQVAAVLGPSGCGKSSLLRAVAGIEPTTSGQIVINGEDQARVPTHRRSVGLMFQDHALFPHLSVGENVAFGLRMAGQSDEQIAQRTRQLLELVGLADRTDARPHELSGGQAQRVALARTLAPSPRVICLDEPMGSLDRVLRRDLIELLQAAFATEHSTVLYVSHDRDEAFALANTVSVMRDGRIVQTGTGDELMNHPVDEWVSDFLS